MPRIERLSNAASGSTSVASGVGDNRPVSLRPFQSMLDESLQTIQNVFQQVADAALDLKYSGQMHEQAAIAGQLQALNGDLDTHYQQLMDWRQQLAEIVQQHQQNGQMDNVSDFEWNEKGANNRTEFQDQLRQCLDEESVLDGLADDQHMDTDAESNDNDEDEDNIEMVGEKLTFRCPITQSRLVVPVRSRVCKHVYEKNAIQTLLSRHPTQRCPVGGCSRPLTAADLFLDIGLLRKLKRGSTAKTQ